MKIDKIVFSESFKKEALAAAAKIAVSGEKTGSLDSPFDGYSVSTENVSGADPVHVFEEGGKKIFVFSK